MTLETAKALKEAGWDKETEKVYTVLKENPDLWFTQHRKDFQIEDLRYSYYPNPSLEELLAVMPCEFKTDVIGVTETFELNMDKLSGGYYFAYRIQLEDGDWRTAIYYKHPDPTEAVAQLWLKLRKEGIV